MATQETFEQLKNDIMGAMSFSRSEATGFYSCHCPVCGDTERKTGGFKFEHDKIVYNCFHGSCDSNTVLEFDNYVPRKFKELMNIIGVKIPMSLLAKRNSIQKMIQKELDRDLFEPNTFKEMQIDDGWLPLAEAAGYFPDDWKEYLTNRCCSINDVYFIPKGKYKNLIAIILRFYDKVIGFEIVTGNHSGVKYLLETENEGVLYLPDHIPQTPTIIVEGALDAKCFPNTCATLKSRLSPKQAYHLRNVPWIFLPDKVSNNFLQQMKYYPDAKIVIPDWHYNDLNAAVCAMGVLEVAERINQCTIDNFREAEVKYRLWIEGK